MPLATWAPTVDATGISAPDYDAIYADAQARYQAIFGTDAYIDPDSQDGQLLAVFVKGISDANAAAIATYNNFSPVSAQGAALSSSVKLNGLHRHVPTASTALVRVVGQAGTNIVNGLVSDAQGAHQWALPSPTVIPNAGQVDVIATCVDEGAVPALAGTLTKIVTPTLGWQSAINLADATLGNPVETDADLRRRQSKSVAYSSADNVSAVIAGLAQLPGVLDLTVHENPTGAPDGVGVPAHSIACVVQGGADADIASVIAAKKSPGCGTYGTVSQPTLDPNGLPITVEFSHPTAVVVNIVINLHANPTYSTAAEAALEQSVYDYLNSVHIGAELFFNNLWVPASLAGTPYAGTYQIASMTANGGTADIPVAYNAQIQPGTITVNHV
jgi:uncharacterized phage protein gp47/JayE